MVQKYLFFALLLAPDLLLGAQQVQRPQLPDGAFWQYRVSHKDWVEYRSDDIQSGDYELLYTRGRVVVFKLADGKKGEISGPAVGELRHMLGTYKSPSSFLEFPLFEGKKWKTKYKGAGNRPVYTDHLVTATKSITIPAGTFEALRVERDDRDRRVNTREYYYVVECGCIALYSLEISSPPSVWPRRYFGKRQIELLKFGPDLR